MAKTKYLGATGEVFHLCGLLEGLNKTKTFFYEIKQNKNFAKEELWTIKSFVGTVGRNAENNQGE